MTLKNRLLAGALSVLIAAQFVCGVRSVVKTVESPCEFTDRSFIRV